MRLVASIYGTILANKKETGNDLYLPLACNEGLMVESVCYSKESD
jgi:hypothetical protein